MSGFLFDNSEPAFRRFRGAACGMLAILLACWCSHALSLEHYLVGAASTSISPPTGTLLAGYGRDRRSTGEHDPLYARAVVIDDRVSSIIIVTLDNIGLTRPDILQIQERAGRRIPELAPDRVIVSSTHTHAGPDVVGLWGTNFWSSGRDQTYVNKLIDTTVDTIVEAHQARQPATSRVGSRQVTFDWVENVSEPELLDQTLSVLQFNGVDGKSIATLTNHACHPTVLGPDNTMVSADYVEGFYASMSAALPGQHLFLQGAIGGWVQPLQGDRSHDLARKLGSEVATAALQVLSESEPSPTVPLTFASVSVALPLDNWTMRVLMWFGILDRETIDGQLETGVARFTVANAEFVTHPGETSPYYSKASRELMSTRHGFVMGLTQDALGYILKPDYFEHTDRYPHAGYLTSVSVGKDAGPLLMQSIESLRLE